GLVRPAADLVLPVPMVIDVRPDHQGDIPPVTRTERSGEIRTRVQAIARRAGPDRRAVERGVHVAGRAAGLGEGVGRLVVGVVVAVVFWAAAVAYSRSSDCRLARREHGRA